MGMPSSKQINTAFDQVTPLVQTGFRVLDTIKNVSILVAVIQALNVLLLWLILLSLLGLLITVNPDLEAERRAVVTPVVEWIASWVKHRHDRKWLEMLGFVVFLALMFGAWMGILVTREAPGHCAAWDGRSEQLDGDLLDEEEAIEALKLTRRISEP
ncbi:hypothetical protein V8F33_008188 [Rhypophila sp. PSN 637]